MAVQPEAVELAARFQIVVVCYGVSEDATIPTRTIAGPVVSEVLTARIRAEHVVAILDSRLHMVMGDDNLRMTRDGVRSLLGQPAIHGIRRVVYLPAGVQQFLGDNLREVLEARATE